MSKKKQTSIKEMASDKLLAEVTSNKKELMALRFKQKLGELTDTSLFQKAKKAIAKALTELNSRNKTKE